MWGVSQGKCFNVYHGMPIGMYNPFNFYGWASKLAQLNKYAWKAYLSSQSLREEIIMFMFIMPCLSTCIIHLIFMNELVN